MVGLLLVVLVHPTHELVISLAGQGDKAPVLQLHFPFLAHCLISGYRIGIGDQVDLLIILPDCLCHTPLGPKHIISSLHHLQCPFVQKLRGGFELVRMDCPQAENLISRSSTSLTLVHV